MIIKQLAFSYPEQALNLYIEKLSIAPGESVALVGPSGSGKTTLLNLMCGILTPQSGNVIIDEENITQMPEKQCRDYRLNHIGMIFQSFELLDYLTVFDNILLQARLSKQTVVNAKIKSRAKAIAEHLGLYNKLSRNVVELSQGERQRVAVCRALLLEPSVVLADEPTGNLDPENKLTVLQKLIEECKQKNRILLTVTHDHSLLTHFDRVLDMKELLIQSGKAHE
ncbi:MAG: ABC transporter ATP-binding protein [Colwellia sp.]|nr:ABC transporter ATP-binding protein [Colwellia sp.]